MLRSSRAHIIPELFMFLSCCGLVHTNARPSISFGPPINSAFYTIDSPEVPFNSPAGLDPFDTAKSFIETHSHSNGYKSVLRSDTYTDKRTGITHVYARQMADNAHTIANSNMNINIRNGKVLSYGTSFLHGNPQSQEAYLPTWSLEDYCNSATFLSSDFTCGHFRNRLRALASTFGSTVHPYNPGPAAFFFSLAAYPGPIPSNASLHNVITGFERCPPLDVWPGAGCEIIYRLPNVRSDVLARRTYIQTPVKGSNATKISLVWNLEVELPDNRYEVYTALHDPFKVVMVVDWTIEKSNGEKLLPRKQLESEEGVFRQSSMTKRLPPTSGGTYRVWKWDTQYPMKDKRTLEVAPYNNVASPLGWHKAPTADDPIGMGPGGPHGLPWSPTTYSTPLPTSVSPSGVFTEYPRPSSTSVTDYTDTGGNNVIAQASWLDEKQQHHAHRPNGGSHLVFDFSYPEGTSTDSKLDRSRRCANATVTQYFYLANMFHDIMFQYGFGEESGNFQQYNFGRSEGEQDALILDVQDGHAIEKAIFTTPPDGKSGYCQMKVQNFCNPFGNEEAETYTLLQALAHGLAVRLTGGPRDSSCLAYGEATGLGMGWADFISRMMRGSVILEEDSNPKMLWLYNRLLQNNTREAFAVGETWANMLEEVMSRLVSRYGFAHTLFPSAQKRARGNVLMLQLLINGLKLQPCRPTFLQARDAMIAADRDLTGGTNRCLLWEAFASRGLGNDAKSLVYGQTSDINGFDVPHECREPPFGFSKLVWAVFCFASILSYGLWVVTRMRMNWLTMISGGRKTILPVYVFY